MPRVPGAAKFLVDSGLLAEINRLVLHPRGLALAVSVATTYGADGKVSTVSFSDALNATDDPEGYDVAPDALEDCAQRRAIFEEAGALPRVTEARRALFPPDGIQPNPKAEGR